MIDGVKIIDLKKITDERGMIFHMLKNTDKHFQKFGEIYFSCGYPGVVKAWHIHKEMTLNYAVRSGQIKFVLFDDRKKSPTKGILQEIFISPENYHLVTVPPLIWNGFKSVGNTTAIVANCSTHPHSDSEISRLPFDDPKIPYKWDLTHK